MFIDYHVHTSFSDDSEYPMEEVIKKAISLGINEICFTEHVDYGVKVDVNSDKEEDYFSNKRVSNCNYTNYIKEFERCKEIYESKIVLKLGIEFGIQTHTINKFQRDFDKFNFDFVILSCHQVDDKEFFIFKFQEGKTQEEYNRRYYQELLEKQIVTLCCVLNPEAIGICGDVLKDIQISLPTIPLKHQPQIIKINQLYKLIKLLLFIFSPIG